MFMGHPSIDRFATFFILFCFSILCIFLFPSFRGASAAKGAQGVPSSYLDGSNESPICVFFFSPCRPQGFSLCETIQVVVLILLSACLRLGERGRWREQQRSCRRRIYFCPFPLFVSYTHTNTNSAFDGGKLTLLGGPPIAPVALALSHCTFRTFAFWILAWHHLAKISLSFPPFNVAVDAFNELVSVQFVV